jgi:formylglycine-generating enzyme required for sulfatase activity
MPMPSKVDPPDGYSETWPKKFTNRLPIFVRLSEFFPFLPRSVARDLSRPDFETALFGWVASNSESLAEDVIRSHLAKGSTLLVLDGVDEVPKVAGEGPTRWSPRALLLSGLANSCAVWERSGNRLLVTSRPYGLTSGELSAIGLAHAPILELDLVLRNLLIQRWFDQLRGSTEGETFANGLLAHFDEHKWLEPLSVSPLLLTGMCIVYDEGGKLPQDPHELYSRVVNTVLHSRYPDDVTEMERARRRLQAVAYGMHTGSALETRQAPIAETSLNEIDSILSDYLRKSRSDENDSVAVVAARDELLLRSGLLQARGHNKAGFYHLSFQEFLAGQRIADLDDDLFPLFSARADSADWRNTLLLIFAGLSPDRAVRLADRLVAGFTPDSLVRQASLQTLVAECIEILRGRGIRLSEVAEDRCRTAFQFTMVSGVSADVRCRVGSSLGLLGDPRFHGAALWYLPKEPALGLLEIPAGPFTMGSDSRHDPEAFDQEMPRHRVTLTKYYIARWPVTVAQFRAFAAHRDNRGFAPRDPSCLNGVANHPVSNVSRQEAFLYCNWLTAQLRSSKHLPRDLAHISGTGHGDLLVTLPSEAEWEKAARMSEDSIFPWGNDPDPNRANYVDTGIGGTSPVGCFPLGANPISGIEEMSGNVWEWTRSIWNPDYPYKPGSTRETLAPTHGLVQTVRGGAFDLASRFVRATYRNAHLPQFRPKVIGFRIAVSNLASDR